ncbi:Fruiting body protein SC7 [Mycena sanguinolenta]|uniref:Fruiting body protein SC7 n=1 Tax=Mycena sanguinolenta TaxID=230812 RepID=A0A8H6XEM2_9AGAR|nr:Fruiting body protein SC7 [Mycena sanguinolenta]
MMGTNAWGSVMSNTGPSDEAWNNYIALACGEPYRDLFVDVNVLNGATNCDYGICSGCPSGFGHATRLIFICNFDLFSVHYLHPFFDDFNHDSQHNIHYFILPPPRPKPPPPPSSSSSNSNSNSNSNSGSSNNSNSGSSNSGSSNSGSSNSGTTSTTSSSSSSSGGNGSNASDDDVQAYLTAHNTIRAQHGAVPVTWSNAAAEKAQQWANECTNTHSGGTLGPLGENLAAGTGTFTIAQAVKAWTDEVSNYNPNDPQPSHFTQVVWKATTEIGCAVQTCDGIFAGFGPAQYYVCEYSPQGNVIGEFSYVARWRMCKLDGDDDACGDVVVVRDCPVFTTCGHSAQPLFRPQFIRDEYNTASFWPLNSASPPSAWFLPSDMFVSKQVLRILSNTIYGLFLLLTIIFTGISCVALLAQAVRHAPSRTWKNNVNALVIGVSYATVLVISLLFCVKRRLAVRMRLQRISKAYTIIRRGDVPNSVHEYMSQEYMRTCLVSHESVPTDTFHPGWGRPDALAHAVIPAHPQLKPHARMLHHFRFILPLLNSSTDDDDEEFTPLHYYDSAIQLARNAAEEPTEEEFLIGMQAADDIRKSLNDCRLEALESSITDFDSSTAES